MPWEGILSTNIYDPVCSVLEQQFKTAWEGLNPAVPIKFENLVFQRPGTAFVSFTVKFADGNCVGLGGIGRRLSRQSGIIAVQIFTPTKTGPGPATKFGDQAANIFRYKTFTSGDITIRCSDSKMQDMPRDVDFFGKLISFIFEADGFF